MAKPKPWQTVPPITGPTYSLASLAAEACITEKRIRKWIEKGVLPKAVRNPTTGVLVYTSAHVERIRLILAILDANMTLDDIRDYFNPLDTDEEALVDELEEVL